MAKRNDFEDQYASIEETAEALGVSVRTVNRMLDSGTLKRVKAGWSTLIDRTAINRLKKEREQGS